MAIDEELQKTTLDQLYLDAKNPRLGLHDSDVDLPQEDILDMMHSWVLDELAVSYLESGFWTHEALLVVEETLYGQPHFVVVEGNRRLAALKYLHAAHYGEDVPRKWQTLVQNAQVSEKHFQKLFDEVPYILVDSRREVDEFLGFRHVTGIKQWHPEQKAQYIAKLIDERDMSYEEVMQKIGSRTPTVRHHYISYRLLLQIDGNVSDFSFENAAGRFSVMYLSLRTQGVKNYLNIDLLADKHAAKIPVPQTHLDALANFALWLFGNQNQDPLFTDSRRVNDFGKILESHQAVQYLEENKDPKFNHAWELAGGDELEIAQLVNEAATNVKLALSRVHHYKDSEDIQQAIKELGIDVKQLLSVFPSIDQELHAHEEEN